MACDCLARMNDKLAGHNTRICETFAVAPCPVPTIQVTKIENRGKAPMIVVASFCPFCGEPYQDLPDKPAGERGATSNHVH